MASLRTVTTMCVLFHLCSRSTGRRMVVSTSAHRPVRLSAFTHPSIANHHVVSLLQRQQTMPISFLTEARPLEGSTSYRMPSRRLSSSMPSKRSADDYDDLFFVPATPKPFSQNYVPLDEDDEGDEQVTNDYDINENSASNFFDDDYEYDRDKFRAAQPNISPIRARSTSSPMQQAEPRKQQPYPPKQSNYRAATSNTQQEQNKRQQQQQQQYSQPTQTGIPSTRALYQFRPIQPGSTRQMPPTLSNYDSDEYDVYNFEEEKDDMNIDQQIEGMTDEDVFAQADSDYDPFESGQVKRSAKIITKDASNVANKQPAVKSVAPQVTAPTEVEEEEQASLNALSNNAGTSKNGAQLYPRTLRNFTPAFMEPPRVKAFINNTDKADNMPRKIPVEASSGNVSTSYIDTLSHQLEHLQAQIYQLNDGVKFNIGSPKQVAKVLFGEDDEGSSTNKDVLEALASAGNVMAENIYKWRRVTSQIKKELKRIEQLEKGDKKNDYYGNLSRRDNRQSSSRADAEVIKEEIGQVAIFETVPTKDDITAPAMDSVADRETLLLIDASAYIFRSYHAMPPLHRSGDGMPTGALHGVCRMLQNLLLSQLLKGEQPRVILCFDAKGDNFRHELYPEYKANRGPCPEDLIPQFDLVKEAATAFGLVQVEAEGYEADDVIATLSRLALDEGMNVDIMSGDKDLWQLVTAPNVFPRLHMIDPLHLDSISHDAVVEKWGVSSDKLGDLLALAGDASDNIKGAPGIGPKIAAQLINEFGSLSELLANTDKIKQKKRRESLEEHAENVMLFRQLVALEDTVPVDRMMSSPSFEVVSDVRMSSFDPSKLVEFYERMELRTCKNDLERRLRSSSMNYKQPPTPSDYSNVPF